MLLASMTASLAITIGIMPNWNPNKPQTWPRDRDKQTERMLMTALLHACAQERFYELKASENT